MHGGWLTKLKNVKMPHTLVVVEALVLLVLVASWIIPSGQFDRVPLNGRLVPDPATYHVVQKIRLSPAMLVLAPLRGFLDGGMLIAFLLVIGGAFNVLNETGAVEVGIKRLTRAISARPTLECLMIPVLMTVFSLAGSIFGLGEELIPFVVIFIPLARSLGYDSIVGVCIPFLGAAAGFAAAFLNPFTVGVAQKIAGLPINSGLGYRVFTWAVGTAVMVAYVMVYARRIKRDPSLSPVRDLDEARGPVDRNPGEEGAWTPRLVLVLALFAAFLVLLVYGIMALGWDMDAMGALFLAMGIALGLASGMGGSRIAQSFVAGAKDMVGVVFIVACARALLVIANDAKILDTVLFHSKNLMGVLPRAVIPQTMFLIQTVINFFIHSGTAQAALTMPIMAPLGDLVGVTRQTSVYAFQLCEFVNPILPTSAVTMGVLGAAKLPWERWAAWFLPLMGILILLAFLLLIPPVLFHYGPF
ncbi:YfcC family protein [Mesoterricola sediminis]|uniref:C4-dicarboxylate ABC transporter n=1 Tax=Mesoterricola sediminis TaxID=2927980 RepID=A0AA48GTK0_9BACT|nr:Na+/H+ antiporter NhaC family protein [Mesoterricola sediminis]BDU75944.1 C4-dicarboxylate ABC transporter [Mesoterricola sediminis]